MKRIILGALLWLLCGAGALCSASLEEFKDVGPQISPADAGKDLMVVHPFWGKFKDEQTGISDHRIQPFFGAHQVEGVDSRLSDTTMLATYAVFVTQP
jgi:hypothetical protein